MRGLLAMLAALAVGGCALPGARPMDFACAQSNLGDSWQGYAVAPIQQQIQQDAYPPGHSREVAQDLVGTPTDAATVARDDIILSAIREHARSVSKEFDGTTSAANVLMLSGGAGWGAYGAGFLQRYAEGRPRPRWDVITGVSTGALQSLRVALGEYDALVSDYTITDERDLAIPKGMLNVLRAGYMYDTTPLRRRLEDILCENDCRRLRALAADGTPTVLIGTVDMRSGDFRVLNVKTLLRGVYYPGGVEVAHPDPVEVRRVAQCLVGTAMASAAVPVFQRPVRLGGPDPASYRTYADGGVRLSLFDVQTARAATAFAAERDAPVTLFALRNGPTIVRPAEREPGSSNARIDARPDALAMALRSYSVIVNQAEVSSIASLRLVDPDGAINYTSADGYDWKSQPCRTVSEIAAAEGRRPRTQPIFDAQFMRCLIAWGRDKEEGEGWIALDPLGHGRALAIRGGHP